MMKCIIRDLAFLSQMKEVRCFKIVNIYLNMFFFLFYDTETLVERSYTSSDKCLHFVVSCFVRFVSSFRFEYDVCVWIYDKTFTIKNHCGVRSTTCVFGYTITVLL